MLMEHIEEVREGNMVAHISYDPDPTNPRDDLPRGHGSVIACYHKRYNLGDVFERLSMEQTVALVKERGTVSLPIYGMDHGSFVVSTKPFRGTHAAWDSGRLGVIYMTRDVWQQLYGWKNLTKKREEQIRERLQAEFDEWACYVHGDTYLVELWEEHDDDTWDQVDVIGSVCGIEAAREAARDLVKGLI